MENPIKMDDLGGFPIFLETPICRFIVSLSWEVSSSASIHRSTPTRTAMGIDGQAIRIDQTHVERGKLNQQNNVFNVDCW